ncbi:MAG: Gfo/Idh/MocA family oxidoreductase [Oscillospiraceae bacterium]|nr:Gfo/Idh/MocA family oxidoreductase [Oscillospiraceae bacterium]
MIVDGGAYEGRTVTVGVVGTGFMGKTHAFAYKSIPFFYAGHGFRVRLRGVCSAKGDNAAAARDAYGFDYATDDIGDLLADPTIDALSVCTPNNLHYPQAKACILAGKGVYCEKPLTTDPATAYELADLARSRGVVARTVFHNRSFPATMKARRMVGEGRLGDISSFRICYLHSGSVDADRPAAWRMDEAVSGGGTLFDLGSHALDMACFLMGGVNSLVCATKTLHAIRPAPGGGTVEVKVDDYASLILRMSCGAVGTVEVSKIATGANDELTFELHGSKGAVRFSLMDPNWLHHYDNTDPKEGVLGGDKGYRRIECVQRYPSPGGSFPSPKASVGWLRGHVHGAFSFLDNVLGGAEPSPTFDEGAYVQLIMGKAYESSRTSSWVDVRAPDRGGA